LHERICKTYQNDRKDTEFLGIAKEKKIKRCSTNFFRLKLFNLKKKFRNFFLKLEAKAKQIYFTNFFSATSE